MPTELTPSQIKPVLAAFVQQQVPVIVWGPPGIGKSSVWQQVGDELDIECRAWMRTSQMDSVDVRGLPKLNGGDHMEWLVPDWYPTDPDSKGILVFDEITQGHESVQAALMQLVLERRLGNRKLPDGWAVGAAANRESDRSATYRMPAALSRRFTHLHMKADVTDWCRHVLSTGKVEAPIVAFIRFRPELLHQFDPKLPVDPNPRAWERASEIVKSKLPTTVQLAALEGTVGEGAAVELTAFLQIWASLPSIDGILLNPQQAPVPTDPSTLCAVAGALASRADTRNFGAVMTYAERMGAEFATFTVRDAIARAPALQGTRAFTEWAVANAEILL